MENQLANLVKGEETKAAYFLGLFYGKIKLSERLSTFYGATEDLNDLIKYLNFYVSRKGEGYVCIESYKLSTLLRGILPLIVKKWEFHSDNFTENFLLGYAKSNIVEMRLGSDCRFKYIKGKKRILKDMKFEYSFLVKMSQDYILYILDKESDLKKVSDFDSVFNISKSDQYKALIGLILGDGHMKKYDYIQITHTDRQEPYIRFMKKLFDYWGIKSTVGKVSEINKTRKDGSKIRNHYFYITLDKKDYFKNRVSLSNKQVNSYIASRINDFSLLFWFLDDGNYTKSGINFFTNGFDNLSENILKKYLDINFGIQAKTYTTGKYRYLHLSVADTEKLMVRLDKFIPYLPSCFKSKFANFQNPLCII